MTYEEYLAFERASPDKHEFVNGHLFAMAGARFEHNQLALSERTEAYDRGERTGDAWTLRTFGPGERFALTAVGTELAVDDVYANVVLTERA